MGLLIYVRSLGKIRVNLYRGMPHYWKFYLALSLDKGLVFMLISKRNVPYAQAYTSEAADRAHTAARVCTIRREPSREETNAELSLHAT